MAAAVRIDYKVLYTIPSGFDFIAIDFDFRVHQVAVDCYDVRQCCWLLNFVQICSIHQSN